MKSPTQRRGITSKKKALSGIVHKLRDGSQRRNRKNDWVNNKSQNQIEYANVEKSARTQEERDWAPYSALRDEGFHKPISKDRFREYRNRNQKQHERDFQTRSNERYHKPHFKENYVSPYGEHSASRGRIEYLGGNKRHPGLGKDNYKYRDSYWEEPLRRREDYYYNERKDNSEKGHYNHKNNARLAYEDYMNRGQFERPFHGREIYDPTELEYERIREEDRARRNHLYRYEGYQSYGNIEGFGISTGKQHGQDWREEDEYRHGHARRKIGYGKFGSR